MTSLFGSMRTPRGDPLQVGVDEEDSVGGGDPRDTIIENVPVPCNIVKPTMGGTFQHRQPTGDWVAWTGGKPKLDWSGLEDEDVAVTPMMYRETGGKDAKGYKYRITGLSSKFETTGNLRSFCRSVMKHFRQCGLDTITYLPDPANPTRMESVVESPNRFTKAYVLSKIVEYESLYDDYDRKNAQAATDYVIDSLSAVMENRVSEALASTSHPGFLITWMTLIEKIRILSVQRFDNLEKKIIARKPTDYPGQNLDAMAAANITDFLDLQQGGWYSVSTGIRMVENFASANRECDEYKLFAFNILTKYREAVRECSHMAQEDRVKHMDDSGFNFEAVCLKFGDYYLQQHQDGRWLPSKNVGDSRAPPRNFGNLAHTTGNKAYNLVQNVSTGRSSGPNRSSNTCNNCGKEGHWARDCPSKGNRGGGRGTNSGGRSGGRGGGGRGPSHSGSSSSWIRVPPEAGKPQTKTEHGKTFHWCATCRRWSTTHGTDQHRSKQVSSDGDAEKLPKVNLAMIDNFAAWHCPFNLPDQTDSAPSNACPTVAPGNLIVSLLSVVLIVAGMIDIILCWSKVVIAAQALGGLMMAPFIWVIVLVAFLHYQPVFAVPPPEPDPPKFNRRQKRCFGRLLRKALPRPNNRTKMPSMARSFHRSYPMRLRGAGIYCQRSDVRYRDGNIQFASKSRDSGMVPPHVPPFIPHTTRREGEHSGAPYLPYYYCYLPKKSRKQREPKRYCFKKLFPFPEPENALFLYKPFEKMRPSQKVAVSEITNKVCMYRPVPSQYRRKKKVEPSPFITPGSVPLHNCLPPELRINVAQPSTAAQSSMLQFMRQYSHGYFNSTLNKMDRSDAIIWDSGASQCVTPHKSDFIGPIERLNTTIKGISPEEVGVKGHGCVAWPMEDANGVLRTLKLPCLWVPKIPQRLLSTTSLLQTYPDESISLSPTMMRLSGNKKCKRKPIEAHVNPKNNLPTTMFQNVEKTKETVRALANIVTTVSEENSNLGAAEKELLKWHQRLAHIDFRKVMFLFRTGILSHGEANRHMHTAASKIKTLPKCAACQFGKQCQRSVPTTTQAKVSDKVGAISRKCALPGEQVSVDHFVCKVKGRLFSSKGKSEESMMYSGGCVFVDHYSGMIHVELQQNLNTHETLKAKESFEGMARDSGVVPQMYLSDNGPAFASHEFAKHLSKFEQVSKFAGAGAHHQNGIAERSIRTVISIARTIMMHAAIHWPEMSDPCLWPMAVQHAAYVFNRMPHLDTGLCPLDLFNRQRWKQSQLHDLHVWGCPVYVLDKRTADGIKIPKWKPRSNRFVYMGTSNKHASNVPLLLNPDSGVISPQYHVVFDDWFATISATKDELPDFHTEAWQKMFGDSVYQYVHEGDSDVDDTIENIPAETMDHAIARQRRVGDAMDREMPSTPLPVPPPPQPNTFEHTNYRNDVPPSNSMETPLDDGNDFVLDEENRDLPAGLENHRSPPSSQSSVPIHPPTPSFDEQRERQVLSPFAPQPELIQPSPIVPITAQNTPNRDLNSSPNEFSQRVTRSMSRTNEVQPLRRSQRLTRPPEKLNLWMEFTSLETPYCYTLEHPSELQGFHMSTEPFHSYLVEALSETTPTTISASTIVSIDAFKASIGDPDTLSYDEAMADKENVDEWRAAMRKEVETLEAHGTWECVPLTTAKSKVLPGTWVFRVKRSPDGTIIKRKARYCVRGDLQEGQRETFAPVVAWSTVRLFLVLAMLLVWETSAIDFSSAFVQAFLKEPTWIHLPRGFQSSAITRQCLRLKKSLYGLAVAPRLWYLHLFDALVNKLGFTQSKLDRCLLMKKDMMMIVFVDDCGIAYRHKSDFAKLIADLRRLDFELTEEGSFTSFLGIKFDRTPSTITMTQSGLIDRIAVATGLTVCNPNHTPTTQEALGSDPDGLPMKETWNYRSIIGMLLYLSTNTRPDIAFAVSQAARFSNNPKQSHATAVKTIVRYLVGTKNRGTIVTPTGQLDIQLYVDADFAGLHRKEPDADRNSARSRTGYVLFLGGFPLIWKSHLQTEISLSTLEAEYSALSSATRALIPIRELLFEVSEQISLPRSLVTTIHCAIFEDNQGAFLLATTQRITNRTKYFLVKFHHFWHYIELEEGNSRKINVVKCSTEMQRADCFTKGQVTVVFRNNRLLLLGW